MRDLSSSSIRAAGRRADGILRRVALHVLQDRGLRDVADRRLMIVE